MTWRVDFVDRFTYSVQHSLSLADGLDNIRLNADKIAGTSYFAKEPRHFDHERLRDVLKGVKGRWLLSYDDCPEVRELYKGFTIDVVNTRYSVSGTNRVSSEILIRNY